MFIYKLMSPSGKSYIGLTKQFPEVRFQQHVQLWKQHKDKPGRKTKLQQAFNKYDPNTWTVETLFETNDIKELQQKEIEFIKQSNNIANGYNINIGGDLGSLGRIFDEEHRSLIAKGKKDWWDSPEGQKFKKQQSEKYSIYNPGAESRKGKPAWNSGTKQPEQSEKLKIFFMSEEGKKIRENISKAHKGKPSWNKNIPMTEKAKENLRNKKLGVPTGKSYPNQKKAARELMQRTYLVTGPAGEQHIVTNLRQWALERGLEPNNMYKGKSKGWSAKKIEGK